MHFVDVFPGVFVTEWRVDLTAALRKHGTRNPPPHDAWDADDHLQNGLGGYSLGCWMLTDSLAVY